MSVKSINPYLNFNGTGAKAIALYEKAFGAKSSNVMRYGEMPGEKVPPELADHIMHARLDIGGGVVLISDSPPSHPVPEDSSTQVAVHFTDPEGMDKPFGALADGGEITMPLQETFWATRFGMLKDRFGIRWMFNCDKR
jgi:PhnB protein